MNESKHNLGANSSTKSKARELRKRTTEPERILWSHLRRRKQQGMYFRRQHPYGIYILDFYCFEADLGIEIDGMIHLSRRDYDIERTKYLRSSGLRVIRFNNKDIETRIEWALEKINTYLIQLPPSQPSPTGGRRASSPNRKRMSEGVHHFPLGGNKKGGKKHEEGAKE